MLIDQEVADEEAPVLTLKEREDRTLKAIAELDRAELIRQRGGPPRIHLLGKTIPVLDEGFVTFCDAMGSDASIEQAARQSYGAGTRKVSETRQLIRFLYRHGHSTPFEMGEVAFIIHCPMDMARQLIRHRAASMMEEGSMFDEPSINEYSTRYSEAIDHAATTSPEAWRAQSKSNKQGSDNGALKWPKGWKVSKVRNASLAKDAPAELDVMDDEDGEVHVVSPTTPGDYLSACERNFQAAARALYECRLDFGIAREQARKDLPLSTYTQFYVKCDLRNMLHFLSLRLDAHAQYEIRQYAEVIATFVRHLFPLTWEAFLDYDFRQRGVLLSAQDVEIIRKIALVEVEMHGTHEKKFIPAFDIEDFNVACAPIGWPSTGGSKHREREECLTKLKKLGLVYVD